MTLYIPHSIFHLARLLFVKPETFGRYYVDATVQNILATKTQRAEFCTALVNVVNGPELS